VVPGRLLGVKPLAVNDANRRTDRSSGVPSFISEGLRNRSPRSHAEWTATAVEAIKLGACHYLPKPANTDDIERAFHRTSGETTVPVDGRRTTIKNLEWERIHETLVDVDFNISEAARRLGMHRRTLARKLEKRPVR
jgi:DNA-binding NtrC family response regulator